MKAVLFFDTSSVAAGILVEDARPEPRILALRRLHYETAEGDAVIEALFQEADAWRQAHPGGVLLVGCEQIYVSESNPASRAIQEAINRRKGQLQLLARTHWMTWGGEVAPGTGKLALTGKGNAGKELMVMRANQRFGAQLVEVYGRRLLFTGESRSCCEHEADALGGALAALHGRWIETPAQRSARKKAEKAKAKALGLPAPKVTKKKHSSEFEKRVRDHNRRRREELAKLNPQGGLGI
jgi:hypothetical protein